MRTSSLFSTIAGLSLLATAYAAPTFVSGVTESSGWYDCNKRAGWVWEGGKTPPQFYSYVVDDSKLCWAHAASNILQWWQDKQPSNLIPNGTPNGLASTATPYTASSGLVGSTKTYYDTLYVQQLAIFQDMVANWGNVGGSTKQAYNWFFNGGNIPGSQSGPISSESGAYWSDLGLTMNADGVTSPLFTSETFSDNFQRPYVYNTLQSYVDQSYGITLSIFVNMKDTEGNISLGRHAITMWGYEMDGEDMIVYLTDSDDLKHTLFKQKVSVADNNYVYLTSLDGENAVYDASWEASFDDEVVQFNGAQLYEVQALTAPILNVPEPSSSILTLLGGLVLLRRRRR